MKNVVSGCPTILLFSPFDQSVIVLAFVVTLQELRGCLKGLFFFFFFFFSSSFQNFRAGGSLLLFSEADGILIF
jgi:hypothetical protein